MAPTSVVEPTSGASPYGAAAATTAAHFAPAAMRATRRSGSTYTSVIRRVLMRTPPEMAVVAPWPVAWTETDMPYCMANCTAASTSSAQVAPTTTSGEWTVFAIQGEISASYDGSPGTCTGPATWLRSAKTLSAPSGRVDRVGDVGTEVAGAAGAIVMPSR